MQHRRATAALMFQTVLLEIQNVTTWSVSQIQSHIPNVNDLTETYFGLIYQMLMT